MAQAKDLQHRDIRNPSIPYDTFATPIRPEPSYVAGSNVLTSKRNYLERRPGFQTFEATPTTFTNPVERVFAWHRFDGTFYLMANEVSGSQSVVYKLKVGTDSSFVSLFTSSTATPFDFVVSNNFLFFGNGTDMRMWDGTTLTGWGVTPPSVTPTVATSATGITAVNGYRYEYCYANSSTGYLSSPSSASASTGAFTNKQVDITVTASGDAQVDKIHVFRTTDGGGGIYFEISNSPFANSTATVHDTTPDTSLNTSSTGIAPTAGFNDPPTGLQGFTWYANRIWGFTKNQVWFSGWEEIINGLEETCFPSGPTGNFFQFDQDVTALVTIPNMVIVFTPGSVYKIEGDSLDTFTVNRLFGGMGCRSVPSVTVLGRTVAWLNNDNSIQISDGVSVSDISVPIRPDIAGATPANCALTFFTFGIYQWLVFINGPEGKTWVYDLDLQQWMPPWTSNGRYIIRGETGAGKWKLFLASSNNKVLYHDPSNIVYQDDSSSYSAFVGTNLFDLVPGSVSIGQSGYTLGASPGHLGEPEYISIESDTTQPTTVKLLSDDDPIQGTFTTPVYIKQNPDAPLRTQGTFLKEDWWYFRKPASRRCAVRMDWPVANTNFKLYSYAIAYRPMT